MVGATGTLGSAMVREPEELVEMRRVLGAQLAAFRRAAALSQGQLAMATAVDRTTVAHIEKGRSRADERFWTIADKKCHADRAHMQPWQDTQWVKVLDDRLAAYDLASSSATST